MVDALYRSSGRVLATEFRARDFEEELEGSTGLRLDDSGELFRERGGDGERDERLGFEGHVYLLASVSSRSSGTDGRCFGCLRFTAVWPFSEAGALGGNGTLALSLANFTGVALAGYLSK
jgi:hypothetical protein